jgi:HK97 family phage portal protein
MNITKSIGNLFSRKKNSFPSASIETKDQGAAGFNPLISPLFYGDGEKPILYTSEAVLYMMQCAPVWTALHKIAKGICSIPPKVRDKKTGEFVEHPVLELLAKPDADITFNEFLENCAQWYMGTGNVYIRAIGYIKNPPDSLRVMPSYSTTVNPSGDGYADIIITRLLMIADTYNRQEVKEYGRPRYRYYANQFNEIYQIRSFNPQVGSNMVYGLSPLNAVFYEMRQYIEAAKANMSTLIRSARLSGVWKYEGFLSDQQKQKIQAEVNSAYAGGQNSGRQVVLDKNMSFEDLLQKARDMDYLNTAKHTAETIYKALDIPLPLINAENMTYANYESSQYYLFKDAIIPLRQKIDQELTNFLMPRYDKEDRYEICFNTKDIPQLEPERNTQLKLKKETGIYTINEMRKECESEAIDGGQYIYGTMGNIPIATDDSDDYAKGNSSYSANLTTAKESAEEAQNVQEQSQEKEKPKEETEEEKKINLVIAKNSFIDKLRLQINKDGSPRFTEEEIMSLAQKHYGE